MSKVTIQVEEVTGMLSLKIQNFCIWLVCGELINFQGPRGWSNIVGLCHTVADECYRSTDYPDSRARSFSPVDAVKLRNWSVFSKPGKFLVIRDMLLPG